MAPGDTTGLTAAEGRRFGVTLAVGFSVLGALFYWRGRTQPALIFMVIGAGALMAGLLLPTRLRPVQRGWMALGVALSRVTTPAFYTVLYLAVLTPTGWMRRTLGRSPLERDAQASSYWVRRPTPDSGEECRSMERQF